MNYDSNNTCREYTFYSLQTVTFTGFRSTVSGKHRLRCFLCLEAPWWNCCFWNRWHEIECTEGLRDVVTGLSWHWWWRRRWCSENDEGWLAKIDPLMLFSRLWRTNLDADYTTQTSVIKSSKATVCLSGCLSITLIRYAAAKVDRCAGYDPTLGCWHTPVPETASVTQGFYFSRHSELHRLIPTRADNIRINRTIVLIAQWQVIGTVWSWLGVSPLGE